MASSSTADPNAEPDAHPGSLADAAARLESALARLEALVDAGPLQSELFRARDGDASPTPSLDGKTLRAELDVAHRRVRALEAAAAGAAEALGRATGQVRAALGGEGDADGEGGEPDEPELDLTAATADEAVP